MESFSGPSKQVCFDGRDLDGVTEERIAGGFLGEEKTPIFKFPAGANAGSFMHDVFEHLEFSDSSNWESFIEEKLKEHQYDSEKWTSVILGMVEEVAVPSWNLSLSKLEKEDRLEEMEFHFPMAPGFLPELAGSFPEADSQKYLVRLNLMIAAELRVRLPQGFGGPDFQGKWHSHALDWKSNVWRKLRRLRSKEMEKEMLTHHYVLQYHPNGGRSPFSPKQNEGLLIPGNFGGAYYLFVRGMSVGSENGIYFDSPDFETVRILENFLVSGK